MQITPKKHQMQSLHNPTKRIWISFPKPYSIRPATWHGTPCMSPDDTNILPLVCAYVSVLYESTEFDVGLSTSLERLYGVGLVQVSISVRTRS